METSYDEAAVFEMTFMESQVRHASGKFLFVIMENLSTDFIIGCPTTDLLGLETWVGGMTLHRYELDLRAVQQKEQSSGYIGELHEPRVIKEEDDTCAWTPNSVVYTS